MRTRELNARLIVVVAVVACLTIPGLLAAQSAATRSKPATAGAQTFDTPQQAADALIKAAENYDVRAIDAIFGPKAHGILFSGEQPQERQRVADFVAQAQAKQQVTIDPAHDNRAFLLVGTGDWPFPVPIVKTGDKWAFDAVAGKDELLSRRIGSNELDAIDVSLGYVDAQREYALQKREGYDVNQYAQRIISTPGKQDGLAWRNPDGTWNGPIGEKIARAISQGYHSRSEPYHGYFFKILMGQGPAAPLGQMNFVIKGVMIGGFALVAAPARYGVTGIKTFIVSHDGIVYEKDLGPTTLEQFRAMTLYNPDKTWTPVREEVSASRNQ